MKAWFVGIMFGGFFGFTIASMAFLLELTLYGKSSKSRLLQGVQILIIIILGWVAWKAEGLQVLVGYILGSFYITRLILLPYKTRAD
jgi:hypothetical protein